jgi:hypothetical protein
MSQPPIDASRNTLNGKFFSEAELVDQIALKMGGQKGIGMTEDEWNKQVLRNKVKYENETAEKKRKMEEDRKMIRDSLN